ncbi:hypothetical protein OFO01_08865 [Campylobacter sp. JMF_01 NE2]|uniref:hypothetical protein n=1 Tax=unclassified Campylobacter TaxID=2593542 RepID=UPI0022E9B027|nr:MULTISPECIES: hypothetical protein [unclassified Campylobacter]MDA3053698.1 hypothetical protein [Campylobacter sp. JMF_03 NE3]MDA3067893.1 hypothetical protein [Campylobacter sp. JMF_01 NE2]
MPFKGEYASKIAHNDIIKNPDIIKFLEECPEIPRPEVKELEEFTNSQQNSEIFQNCKELELPKFILSFDGSHYEANADARYPSRKVGYIKISGIVLEMDKYNKLSSDSAKYINPMEVEKLKENTSCLAFALPGAYTQKLGDNSALESFRRTVFENFRSEQSKLGDKNLYDRLFELCLEIDKAFLQGHNKFFKFDKCPNKSCGVNDEYLVPFDDGFTICPHCNNKIFATDVLRVHETFSNMGENVGVFSRLRNILEHFVLYHYIRHIYENDLNLFAEIGVLFDGPLAIYGEGAKFHSAIMKSYGKMREECAKRGLKFPLILGLIKTGRVVEHFMQIKNILPAKTLFAINDKYRYTFINEQDDKGNKNFGSETYYGQDFLIKIAENKQFVVCVLYPFKDKTGNFHEEKIKIKHYDNLNLIIKCLITFGTEMYENGLIPISLAHKHASISLKPGGKMLDIFSRKYFNK